MRPLIVALLLTLAAPQDGLRTASTPRELEEALRASKPGDVVLLAEGDWKDADLLAEAEGSPERPITVRARTPGRTVLTGRSRLRIAGRHVVVDGLVFWSCDTTKDLIEFRKDPDRPARACRLTACEISGDTSGKDLGENRWVSLYGTDHRVDHCYLAGKANAGATLVVWVSEEPNRHRIDHNHFGPRPRLGKNGGETIRVGTSEVSLRESRTLVERNLFRDCDGEVEIVSNKSCGNVYRHNTFLNCQGALTLRHGNGCVVEGNVFLGDGKKEVGGVRVIGEDHRVFNNYFGGLTGTETRSALCLMNGIPDSPLNGYSQVRRAAVAFNTFVGCRSNLVIGWVGEKPAGGILPPEDCVFANNVVASPDGELLRVVSAPKSITWERNLFFGAWTPKGAAALTADPRLEPGEGGLRRPAEGSPLFGAGGGDFRYVVDDVDGQPRHGAPDLGCDQRSTSPVLRRPLAPADVGPAWRR